MPERIQGAFEVYEGKVEPITILTTRGLLQRGQRVPPVVGRRIDTSTGQEKFVSIPSKRHATVINTVNAFETGTCDLQARQMEGLKIMYPALSVVTLSKQSPEELLRIATERNYSHTLLSISDETAEALGVGLKPEEGADPEWSTMLLRMVIVAGFGNIIEHIEHVMDQEKELNYEATRLMVVGALGQLP